MFGLLIDGVLLLGGLYLDCGCVEGDSWERRMEGDGERTSGVRSYRGDKRCEANDVNKDL